MKLVYANEAVASKRRCFFHLVDATDGITAETGEAAGQPQVSSNGGAWTNTGISTLSSVGNGRYYADLTQTLIATAGLTIETRYKSASTAESPGDSFQVVAFDPFDSVRIGLTALPNAAADAAGGLPISDNGGLDMDQITAIQADVTGLNGDAMRGTNSAALASALVTHDGKLDVVDTNVDAILVDTSTTLPAQISGLNDIAATDIVSAGAITTLAGAVVNVDLVDSNTDMRGTDNAALASSLVTHDNKLDTVDANVDSILVDTADMQPKLGTPSDFGSGSSTLSDNLRDMSDDGTNIFDRATDSLQAIRDRGDSDWSSGAAANPNLLLEAEIDVVNTQVEFTLATGSDVDDAYNDQAIVLYDNSNNDYPCTRKITDYVGATKTVTIDSAPVFTLAADDSVKVFVTAPGTTAPTAAENRIEMDNNSTQFSAIVADVTGINGDAMRGTDGANTVVPDAAGVAPTAVENRVEMDSNSTQLAAILLDTGTTLPASIGALPTAVENRVEMDSNSTQLSAIVTDTNDLQTSLLENKSEITSRPADNASSVDKNAYLFHAAVNKAELNKNTGVQIIRQGDAATQLSTRTLTDDGTTLTSGEAS